MIRPVKAAYARLRDDLRENGGAPVPFDVRTTMIFVIASVLLTVYYYWGRPSFYQEHLDVHVVAWLGLEDSEHRALLRYLYWAFSSTLIRVLIPLALIVWWFRESPRDYGFRLWERGHARFYAILFAIMLPVIVVASFSPAFQAKYPFYSGAGDSLLHFIVYELCYGTQFFALEAFFRGFLLFALFRRFGYNAVLIMVIPYCMIHFNKPVAETLGSIVAGLVLGYMAIHSRSWLPGALLHWGIGVAMDTVCILQRML